MKVFVDTSAFVALLVEKEQFHSKVAHQYKDYRQAKAVLFTSHYILDELFTRLLYYRVDIRKHIEKLKDSIVRNELILFCRSMKICLISQSIYFLNSQSIRFLLQTQQRMFFIKILRWMKFLH